ncbi:alpha/beta fold hydrolase [Flavobacteriaceae bacterium M23B6Z8]
MQDHRIKTPAGYSIQLIKYQANHKTKGAFVLSSATGVLQLYYSSFATFLSKQGYTVYTFDYFGIGDSSGTPEQLKRNTVNLSDWAKNDQASVVALAKKEHPNQPVYLITHSIGGQLYGLNPNYHQVAKVLMVASQSGYWKYYEGIHYPKMWLFWNALIPGLTPVFGYFPAKKLGLFENLPRNMAYEWMRWGKHPSYMKGHIREEDQYFDKITSPIKLLSFPRDIYAPIAAADWLADQFSKASVVREHIIPEKIGLPEIGHFGFFRSKFKDSLWKDALNWFEAN